MTEEIIAAGARMGDLDLLPSPFPIEDLLNERELRHVKRLYGIGGLSYGNLSQRKDAAPLLDERERRRQVARSRPRAATSCSSRTTTTRTGGSCSACRRTSSRAACRSTRSSTG